MPELSSEDAPIPEPSQESDTVPKGRPECPEAHKCLASHPLLPPPLLSSGSPSAHPQSYICAVGSLRVCQSPSALQLEDPLSSRSASESRTLAWPVDPVAPPWILTPSSPPWPGRQLALPAPSSLWLRLWLSLTILYLGNPLLRLHLIPPSLQLHLGFQSLHRSSRIHISASVAGAMSPWLIGSLSPPR
ncbi:hypothetical protein H4Q32_008890 [Labeo rohita]|uniref:Uncharacterized protein n=1 Tax=Labeo rohita TaxID=84645 RepID=A0ABQ8M4H2_LABRO|nr:hypothetical protein H4Q32_008890 [Labeo rohita]